MRRSLHHVIVAAAFMAGWIAPAFAQERSRTVLAVHWSSEDFPSSVTIDSTIREVFQSRPDLRIDYYVEYLESDRFPEAEANIAFIDYLKRKYKDRRIEVVVAVSEVATQFVIGHRAELFPKAAIVSSSNEPPPEAPNRLGQGLTGVVGTVADAETLELALNLHPGTEQVFVVAYAPATEYAELIRRRYASFEARVKLNYLSGPLPEVIEAVKAVPARSLVLYTRHSQETPGRVLIPSAIAHLVAEASPVPVYGITDSYIGTGVVGGVVLQTRSIGSRLGELTCRILDGDSPGDIPIEQIPVVPTFDWRQVRRWGIDPSLLPAGADIRFRTPTVWEQYRGYIVGTLTLVLLQALLIGRLLAQRTQRRHAESVIRANEAALRTSYERTRQLAGRLISAQESARTRIARDLHDDVCQELAAMSIEIGEVQRRSGPIQDAPTQRVLASLQRRALALVNGVRRLSHDLHPATLRHVGLAAALEGHCVEVEQRYDVQVSVSTEALQTLTEETALCLYRIAQEALRNAATHGGARRIALSLSGAGDHVELRITDDGRGFDLQDVRRRAGGLGLISMDERAHAVGGVVEILTQPARGTTIHVRVPTKPAADDTGDDRGTLTA